MLRPFFIFLCYMLENIGQLDHKGTEIGKMVRSSTDFLFGENLETILSFLNLISSMIHLKVHQWLQEHLLKCKLKKAKLIFARDDPIHSRLQEGCSFFFHQKLNKIELHAFEYEVLLPKGKLKDQNQITDFSQNYSFYATCNPHN